MQCPNCGFENPEGRRYCEECGEKLLHIESVKARARKRSQREAVRYRLDAERKGLDAEEAERRWRRSRRRTRPWMGIVLVAIIVAVIIVVIVVATGGKSAPEKAVLGFYEAIRDKDVLAYLEHTDLELYKMAKRGEYQPTPDTEGLDYSSYVLENLDTRLLKEEGEYAEVEVIKGFFEGINSDGSRTGGVDFAQYPRKIYLTKVENKWLVDSYNLVKLPYPLPEIGPEVPEFPEVEEPS